MPSRLFRWFISWEIIQSCGRHLVIIADHKKIREYHKEVVEIMGGHWDISPTFRHMTVDSQVKTWSYSLGIRVHLSLLVSQRKDRVVAFCLPIFFENGPLIVICSAIKGWNSFQMFISLCFPHEICLLLWNCFMFASFNNFNHLTSFGGGPFSFVSCLSRAFLLSQGIYLIPFMFHYGQIR